MNGVQGRTLILGVCGGIAAYKAATLASRLTQRGATVHTVMTENATAFIAPLTFASLTGRPPYLDLFGEQRLGRVDHVELAERADLVVVAPATAHFIAKLANGLADDFLSTTLLGVRCPVLLAPAMETHMYEHPAVQANLQRLRERGVIILEPEVGPLASGRSGRGRMVEPETILARIEACLQTAQDLAGVRVLVSAGPTREYLDSVRFISNPSTGKMGFAVAEAAARRGAGVTLVTGPVALATPPGVERIDVETVQEMYDAMIARFEHDCDAVIMTAAVSDYKPVATLRGKRKKSQEEWVIRLQPAVDILEALGRRKTRQRLIGFAAETDDLFENARRKIERKNLDLIVVNDVGEEGAGFAVDTNRVHLLWPDGRHESLPRMSKTETAQRILDALVAMLARDDGATRHA